MNRRLFGWDLPPGCSPSDIPGNRPEDEARDKMIDEFFRQTHFTEEEQKFIDEEVVVEIVTKAIDYGIKIGVKDQVVVEQQIRSIEGG